MNSKLRDIENYIETISNKEKRDYAIEIIKEIEKGNQNIAYHGSCTDGSITAALFYSFEPEKTYIPLDYDILKDQTLRRFLVEQNWFAIVDLEPFNLNTLEIYIDHHRSVIGQTINARRIHFEVGQYGPSAAFVLYNAIQGIKTIPNKLKLLVDVSKVTDTASFAIDPPTELVSKDDLSFLKDFDKLCWFVQDATLIEENYSLKRNNDLVTGLANTGIDYLLSEQILKMINKQREKRILAEQFIRKLEISTLMVIINAPDNAYKQFISLRLGKIGAKVIVFLTQKEEIVTISSRQSKSNTKSEIEYYRLDLFAKKFNEAGGGHAEASGSIAYSIDEALKVIKEWAKEKKLKYGIHNF